MHFVDRAEREKKERERERRRRKEKREGEKEEAVFFLLLFALLEFLTSTGTEGVNGIAWMVMEGLQHCSAVAQCVPVFGL